MEIEKHKLLEKHGLIDLSHLAMSEELCVSDLLLGRDAKALVPNIFEQVVSLVIALDETKARAEAGEAKIVSLNLELSAALSEVELLEACIEEERHLRA